MKHADEEMKKNYYIPGHALFNWDGRGEWDKETGHYLYSREDFQFKRRELELKIIKLYKIKKPKEDSIENLEDQYVYNRELSEFNSALETLEEKIKHLKTMASVR